MAAAVGTLSVTLAAVDRITAPIARITATVTRLQARLAQAGTQLRNVSQFDRLAGAARGVARSMATIIPPLTALTGAASIAGVMGLAGRWASFASQMGTTAYRVMATASSLNALQNAGRLAGVAAEAVTQGLQGLGDALSDAVGGRDSTALQYFGLLGIRMRDAAGNARAATDVLPEVADGIARIADPRLQARVLSALRLPESMLPFLKEGSAGLKRWEEDARRFGVITEKGAEIGAKFAQTQERLKMAAEGLVNSIAQRLAPVIGPMLERLTGWIAANRELIAQRVEEVVTRLAAAAERFIAGGGLQDIVTRIGEIVTGIGRMVEWMGGWEKAAIALGAVLAVNMVAPLAAIAASLTTIAAFRAPGWIARLMGGAGVAAGAAGMAAWQLGDLRSQLRDDALKRLQDAQERDRAENGGKGWLDSDSSLAAWGERLVARLRRNITPGGPNVAQQRFGARGAMAPGTLPEYGREAPGDRQRQAFEFFRRQGWSAEQAAGLVANLRHESGAGLNHRAVGDQGAAYGLAQWHAPRQQAFRLWAGKDIRDSDFEEQLGFVQHELTAGGERAAGAALRAARTAAEAAETVSRRYERPARADAEAAARASTAEGLLPRLQTPAAAPAAAQTAAPQRVEVRISGLPAGATATTTTRDPNGGVRIERAMPGSLP